MISYLQKFRLDGRGALVAGGSLGLGLECATALLVNANGDVMVIDGGAV
jgi:NAD(P)-dependent dehydrogenase (short-subunit alcohol dehydrogenase family)